MQDGFKIDYLSQFTGSSQIFKHWLHRQFVYIEGIQYLARKAECYWLIDELLYVYFPNY